MQKLSGLVLDRYDDIDGGVLGSIFAAPTDIPPAIKEAHRLSADERDRMPDDTFALVIHDDGVTLKKYSMADRGNTALSVLYFLKTGHRLPVEAQKVAAQNLVDACGQFSLTAPEDLKKVAFGVGTLINGALTVPGAAGEASKNWKASKGTGGAIMTPAQIQARRQQGV